jgi:hypothetical protein
MEAKGPMGETGYEARPFSEGQSFMTEQAAQTQPLVCDLQINLPSARDESYLFDLIGRIDHKVLQGYSLYIQISGIAYKVLYGVYWRSVYSDEQYWGLRCEEIERGMWADDVSDTTRIDLPIRYTEGGWTVEEQSLQFLLNSDLPLFEQTVS